MRMHCHHRTSEWECTDVCSPAQSSWNAPMTNNEVSLNELRFRFKTLLPYHLPSLVGCVLFTNLMLH
jgi:hypothetical protein